MEKWSFCDDNDNLIGLVLDGKKTATTSIFDENDLPVIGKKSMLLYSNGKSACIIETIDYKILKFKDIDESLSFLEGEGSYANWKQNHERIFKSYNPTFDDNTLVVFEKFKLIKKMNNIKVKKNVLDIVFGNSCYNGVKESNINDNILMFNTLFNIGDLSNVDNYIVKLPDTSENFKKEYEVIIDNINKHNKIRVWTSRKDIYSYLIMLYVSSIVKKYDYDLYVLYADDYNADCPSPSALNSDEIKKLLLLEHKLSKNEILNNAKTWNELLYDNSFLRVISNGKVKSVSIDFYDDYIMTTLKKLGKVKLSFLVGKLMGNVYLHDNLYVYLINRLIDENKIKIYLNENARYFDSLVEII